MNHGQIRIVCYADNALLTADLEDNLQRLIHKFVIRATKYNKIVSTDKAKPIVILTDSISWKLEIGRKVIIQVTLTFVSSDRNIYEEGKPGNDRSSWIFKDIL